MDIVHQLNDEYLLTFENGSKIRHRKMTKSYNLKVGVFVNKNQINFAFKI